MINMMAEREYLQLKLDSEPYLSLLLWKWNSPTSEILFTVSGNEYDG